MNEYEHKLFGQQHRMSESQTYILDKHFKRKIQRELF